MITKDRGVWVFRCGKSLSASVTEELLQRIREERDLAHLRDESSARAPRVPPKRT